MPHDNLTLDHIIDIHVKGKTVDEIRDEIATCAYRSMMSEHLITGGVRGSGSSLSHDHGMIALAQRIPKRYASGLIDQVNAGFSELMKARPIRYQAVISNHISRKSRDAQAEELGITVNQFKNELCLGREYLSVRFMSMITNSTHKSA